MKLYDAAVSGHSYKVRLMSALLGLDCEYVPVDLVNAEQKSPDFFALNPLGQVPVLDDGGVVLRDSQAILVYLAGKTTDRAWWSNDHLEQAEIVQWLSFSAKEMWLGCAIARAILKFKRPLDLETAQAHARAALEVLEGHLVKHDWLALERPTIADIAVYPYAALVWEGDVSLAPYPSVRAWFKRIESLPGYIPMGGLPTPIE